MSFYIKEVTDFRATWSINQLYTFLSQEVNVYWYLHNIKNTFFTVDKIQHKHHEMQIKKIQSNKLYSIKKNTIPTERKDRCTLSTRARDTLKAAAVLRSKKEKAAYKCLRSPLTYTPPFLLALYTRDGLRILIQRASYRLCSYILTRGTLAGLFLSSHSTAIYTLIYIIRIIAHTILLWRLSNTIYKYCVYIPVAQNRTFWIVGRHIKVRYIYWRTPWKIVYRSKIYK